MKEREEFLEEKKRDSTALSGRKFNYITFPLYIFIFQTFLHFLGITFLLYYNVRWIFVYRDVQYSRLASNKFYIFHVFLFFSFFLLCFLYTCLYLLEWYNTFSFFFNYKNTSKNEKRKLCTEYLHSQCSK